MVTAHLSRCHTSCDGTNQPLTGANVARDGSGTSPAGRHTRHGPPRRELQSTEPIPPSQTPASESVSAAATALPSPRLPTGPTRALDDPLTLGRAARIVRVALDRKIGRLDDHDRPKAATETD
jgi:hypothetical protein